MIEILRHHRVNALDQPQMVHAFYGVRTGFIHRGGISFFTWLGQLAGVIVSFQERRILDGWGAECRMKLSGDSIYDLVFTKPTHLLGLIGGNGLDRIEVGQADPGTASLHIETACDSALRRESCSILTALRCTTGARTMAKIDGQPSSMQTPPCCTWFIPSGMRKPSG